RAGRSSRRSSPGAKGRADPHATRGGGGGGRAADPGPWRGDGGGAGGAGSLRAGAAARVRAVSLLARRGRVALERRLRVGAGEGGEISTCRRQPSGHLYFTRKDDRAQLAAVMFRSAAQVLAFRPADGMDVVLHARASLYPQRGALQLYVEAMEPRGRGALQLAFEQLKARLEKEGLFAADRKRALPRFPRTIGIVTAPGR